VAAVVVVVVVVRAVVVVVVVVVVRGGKLAWPVFVASGGLMTPFLRSTRAPLKRSLPI